VAGAAKVGRGGEREAAQREGVRASLVCAQMMKCTCARSGTAASHVLSLTTLSAGAADNRTQAHV
jgi:hypothetical protein